MNKERIIELAGLVARQRHVRGDWKTVAEAKSGFNMRVVEHDCGSPSCIKGFARTMRGCINGDEDEFLGIDYDTAEELFYPPLPNYGVITPARAASVIRHLAETGEVDWSIGGDA